MARILFIDDDPLSLKMFEKIIELSGHQAVTTSSADEALTLAATQKPDVLFTDFQMPEKNGLDVIRSLRAQKETAHLPAYVVSANPEEDLPQQVLDAGGQGFLRKPLRLDALLTTIQNVVSGSL